MARDFLIDRTGKVVYEYKYDEEEEDEEEGLGEGK